MLDAGQLFDTLTDNGGVKRQYVWDRTRREELLALLETSSTLYLGNLSFYTSEEHIFEFARQAGPIKRVSFLSIFA